MKFLIGGIVLAVFLYFGYRDDWKRSPKEVKTVIVVILLLLLTITCINIYFDLIPKKAK